MTTDTRAIKTSLQPELILTADGSHSLYLKELDEPYHSFHGAIQESKHVFIDAGLKKQLAKHPSRISILEIGFGTGLNALLTLLEIENTSVQIQYTTIEAFPIELQLANKLNYLDLLNQKETHNNLFNLLHACDWDKEVKINNNFTLHKVKIKLQEILLHNDFDLIYFDAFGPPTQPEMWTEEIFQKIYNHTNTNGILVTYCAKGEVKRNLKKVGFTIESLPGPPRKREMVRAEKRLPFSETK